MNMENITSYFSKMEWLKEELIRYQGSKGKNERTDKYYSALKAIKIKQDRKKIPTDEEYISLANTGNSSKYLYSVEYGYYTSNIHYDLFRYDTSEKDQLEERILYFLENADRRTIKRRNGWFMLNFPVDFFRYLIHVYQVDVDAFEKAMTSSKPKQKNISLNKHRNRDLEELIIFVEGYGNSKEKEIINRLLNIVNES